MSIARHHAEWLSLVPVSGPFLSLPVLMEAFNAGLEPHDPDHSRLLRQEYGNWLEAVEKRRGDPAPHQQWIRFVLGGTLGLDDQTLVEGQAIPQTLQVEVPEHHELLRPSLVVVDPGTKTPRMLVKTYPRSQELTSYVAGSPWKASPDTRMTELLHGTGVRLGLVTNGEHWMLVDAPKGETTGYASWYANLWLDEPITLRAFRSLLGSDRFFNVEDDKTLEALLKKSASNQQEVTEQLGYQVRRAVEVLIHSLDRADQDFGRELLAGVKEGVLYESALTVMMRLVFLFCAEERELIPSKPFPVYEQNYSVSMISKQLRELADQHGEELLERRFDAWPRLLAAFRAVFGGLEHDDAHIPAYGGSLFNPDRFPFLEGRKAETTWRDDETSPLPVNNRTVLHLLEALQLLQIRVPGGGPAEARRVSFRALDIEQIGHVYEGLLDHTAKRAGEPYLGLAGTRDKEPEITLAELERLAANGEADLVKFLKEETGRSESALKKGLKAEIDDGLARLFWTACQGDEALWGRVRPFVGLVRLDNLGYPVVIPKGSVFVTAGTDRRSSGTHYTPRSLTEPIVQYTLEPLVYFGPAEGIPKEEWTLRPAAELLDLKVCDMACGSGAFLVQACRYLSERLVEAWEEAEARHPGVPGITPEGHASTGQPGEMLIPNEPEERLAYARRLVAQQCLYGVDKNPLAAEMAKLSLWLLTLAKDKPFTFLDHAIRSGDSLVGISTTNQLTTFSLNEQGTSTLGGILIKKLDALKLLREQLAHLPNNDAADVERKERMFGHVQDQTKRLTYAADLLMAASWKSMRIEEREQRLKETLFQVDYRIKEVDAEELDGEAREALRKEGVPAPFHWPLEFPEALLRKGKPGFDCFIGNPPFMGGRYISGGLGEGYLDYLKSFLVSDVKGNSDIVAYFYTRAHCLLRTGGITGYVGTKTITEGDTLDVGLARLEHNGADFFSAVTSRKWPGSASVIYVAFHWTKGEWRGRRDLDGKSVDYIGPQLNGMLTLKPMKLAQMVRSYQGSYVHGMGFFLSADQKSAIIEADERSAGCIYPCLTASEFNSSPTMLGDRFVIYFADATEEEAAAFGAAFRHVEANVKPDRLKVEGYSLGKYWWRFKFPTVPLYKDIWKEQSVLVCPVVTKYLSFAWIPSRLVLLNKMFAFVGTSNKHFATLQSSLYDVWARHWSGSLGETLQFAPSDCFDNFPFAFDDLETERIAVDYHLHRSSLMLRDQEGLTKTYNRYHTPTESADGIRHLRDLHVEMDRAVAAAYGWSDLDLGHGFHETKQGLRFTISEPARRDVLARLLRLNHERYAEEVKRGLHAKKKAKAPSGKRGKAKAASDGPGLFDEEG